MTGRAALPSRATGPLSGQGGAEPLLDRVELDDPEVQQRADLVTSGPDQAGHAGLGADEHAKRCNCRHDRVDFVAGAQGFAGHASHPLPQNQGDPGG
jgi:hypothetical protein